MRQLRGVGDHPVVLLRGRDGDRSKAEREEELFEHVHHLDADRAVRREDHRRALKERLLRVIKAGELRPRHRVRPDIGEGVGRRDRPDSLADLPLDATAVGNDRAGLELLGVLPHKVDRRVRVERDNHKVAVSELRLGQLPVDRLGQLRAEHNLPVAVKSEHRMLCILRDGLRNRAADVC